MATNHTAIRWLHISDFHLKSSHSYDRDTVLAALLRSLPDLVARFGAPDFVVASGDIAFSGKPGEYDQATALFDRIIIALNLERSRVFVVPGNHDIDRSKAIGLARSLEDAGQADLYYSPGNPLLHIEQRLGAFAAWYDNFYQGIRVFDVSKTFSIEHMQIGDAKVTIGLFNSAGFCLDEHDSGKLFLGKRHVEEAAALVQSADNTLRLAVVHHPFSWISPLESIQIKSAIHDAFDIVLTGHLHENEVEAIAGTSGNSIHLAAGATYQTSDWPNTAMFCSVQDGHVTVSPIHYTATPRPVWTLDTSLFPQSDTYQGSYSIASTILSSQRTAAVAPVTNAEPVAVGELLSTDSAEAVVVRAQLEERLFTTAAGQTVYAEPRLMPRPQMAALDTVDELAVSVAEIATSDASFLIEARPEYGGSTLCRLIQLALIRRGDRVVLRNARDLPNYRKKLEGEFKSDLLGTGEHPVLILDDVDVERDERLLSELKETDWFSRVILVSINRRMSDTLLADLECLPFSPRVLFLWAMGRESIRQFASVVLEANDVISEGRAVDKVYADLLALRIPLTPSNVVMYLRVLQREGDFEPLSRVDILSRYLNESLRRPSDVVGSSFNAKNKMDVLSSFAFYLHTKRMADFDEREWLNFCDTYQSRTLSEFNARDFGKELLEARLFASYSGGLYFRYNFYFSYFLGRFLWPRPDDLKAFISSDDHLTSGAIVDVVTALSSENSEIIRILTDRLDNHLREFATKYVKADFDPLIQAVWPDNDDEDEMLWKPVQAAIAAGPADAKEIDELKTSMLAEARTSNQQITFERFTQLENALFVETNMLADALKNADDVDGAVKVKAWGLVLQSTLVVLQVGTMFAPALARRKRFRWGSIEFVNFDQAAAGLDEKSSEAFVSIITSLVTSITAQTAEDYGSTKLTAVFKSVSKDLALNGFAEVINFTCIATARGRGWIEVLGNIIERTDKTSFYLSVMLRQLLRLLKYDVMPGRDREAIKRLVAMIHTKRTYRKQAPGSKVIKRMLNTLERDDYFPGISGDDKDRDGSA